MLVLISNFIHRHKNTQNNTLSFGSKLPSSGEATNPETQLAEKWNTHINIVHTRDTKKTNTSKNVITITEILKMF